MMYTFRLFADNESDLVAINAIFNAHYPAQAETLELTRYRDDTHDTDYLLQREFIELDGKAIAYGEVAQSPWTFHPQKYDWRVVTYPTYDCYALNALHLEHTLQRTLAQKDVLAIKTSAREDEDEQLRFLQDKGFEEQSRYNESALHLPDFDARPFKSKMQIVADAGIEILDINTLKQRQPDTWQGILYELCWDLYQDAPNPPERVSLETFVKTELDAPMFVPNGWFVAKDGDSYVGVTNFEQQTKHDDKLMTGYTGVRHEYRRQHIGTALKVHALTHIQQAGMTTIETYNESDNPMYALNLQLDFKPTPARINFEKAL